MAKPVQFPIRAKLLLLISVLIVGATAAYLGLAVKLFKDDKTSLVYELNTSAVKTLAGETDLMLAKLSDKVKLLTQGHRDEAWSRAVFEAEADLISYTLYQPPGLSGPEASSTEWTAVTSVRNADYLSLYGLPLSEVDRIHREIKVPFAQVLAQRSWVSNATLAGGAPVMKYALSLDLKDGDEVKTHIAVMDVRLDKLLKLVSGRGIATVYLIDAEGRVLAHPDSALVASRASMADVPIVRDAVASQVTTQLKSFDWQEKRWLGAYSVVGTGGIRVVSQVQEAEAFKAAHRLIEKSLLFALITITLGLLISGWAAHGVTEPLSKLVAATERLSRWEFGELVNVSTRDEVAHLARSFNAMANDLQTQRTQLENHGKELELKVKERTEALEKEKKHLAEAQDALLRTTRLASLGELAGSAAHEVLNPINNMNIRIERLRGRLLEAERGDVTLLQEIVAAWSKAYKEGSWPQLERELRKVVEGGKPLLEEDLENLTDITRELSERHKSRSEDMEFLAGEIVRVTRIINNMRALSRVGGERKPLDVHRPIDDTCVTLSDLFQKRSVTLIKDYSADDRALYSIIGDKDELVQVFSNILRNALHAVAAAKRRAPEIRVTTRRNGDRVEVRIIDNGTGIKPEHLPRVFEPDFTTKSVDEGTGLGLSISRRLVRAFNGDLEVERSVPGEGTTFLVWFPIGS